MDQHITAALCGMDESVRRLIALYCAQHPSENEIADWFSKIDFEALRPEVSCMAAAASSANDYSGVPVELIPRLRGIAKYVHTLNSGMIAGLCILGRRYNAAGICAMLLGSTAVHLNCPDQRCRHMWQMEIAVLEADFSHAVALAKDAGFTIEQTPYSATAYRGKTQCVLIRKGMGVTRNTTVVHTGGAEFLMPCDAQLLISLVEVGFQALSGVAPGPKLLPWLMDLHCLIATCPDWNDTAALAVQQGTACKMRLILELYGDLTSKRLTKDILDRFGPERNMERLAQLLLKYQSLDPSKSKLKRLWLSSQIKCADTSTRVLGIFIKELFRASFQKFTQRS